MALDNTTGSAGSSSRPAAQFSISTSARVLFSLTLIAGLLALVLNAVYAQDQPANGTPAATPEATPSAAMPRIEVQLEEVNESDLGGTVTLFEFGDSTIVEFTATGAGGDHPAVILPGVCGEIEDDPVADLLVVDNRGTSVTTVDISLDDLLSEDHVVEIRMSADDFDTVIACAQIEGEPSLNAAATPESTPGVTPDASPEATGDDTQDLTGVGGGTGEEESVATEVPGTPAGNTLTINLVDWSETGVSGTAVLTADGSSTLVSITINGPGVVGGHEVHIHNGTCGTPGTATYTMAPIDAHGASVSTINLSVDQLTGGNYFINIHPDEANWDEWMVCGNITGTATSADVTPPATVVNQTGDGSVGGNITTVTTSAQAGEFPTTVGVGDALRWPSDARSTAVWAISIAAIGMFTAGAFIRYGERSSKQNSFTRLGL